LGNIHARLLTDGIVSCNMLIDRKMEVSAQIRLGRDRDNRLTRM
jgi:hypothetical protein